MRWVRIYKSAIHHGEEAIVAGNDRAGMVNFSGCHLACRFCYTPETSTYRFGKDYTEEDFRGVLSDLIARGAGNLNLISPSHEWSCIERSLAEVKQSEGADIPLVLKISGYEGQQLVRRMTALADVIIPDFKVYGSSAAKAVNLPANYSEIAEKALTVMLETHRESLYSPTGKLTRGILVRHLLMPGFFDDSIRVMETLGGVGFRGILNLMGHFISPKHHKVHVASDEEMTFLRRLAEQQGMSVLINGKAPTAVRPNSKISEVSRASFA